MMMCGVEEWIPTSYLFVLIMTYVGTVSMNDTMIYRIKKGMIGVDGDVEIDK